VRRGSLPIDSIGEMVNVLDAQRAYEADASTFDVGKRLFQRTIEMGRL
jgi:flagellar basal body rod protein FlgC